MEAARSAALRPRGGAEAGISEAGGHRARQTAHRLAGRRTGARPQGAEGNQSEAAGARSGQGRAPTPPPSGGGGRQGFRGGLSSPAAAGGARRLRSTLGAQWAAAGEGVRKKAEGMPPRGAAASEGRARPGARRIPKRVWASDRRERPGGRRVGGQAGIGDPPSHPPRDGEDLPWSGGRLCCPPARGTGAGDGLHAAPCGGSRRARVNLRGGDAADAGGGRGGSALHASLIGDADAREPG